MDRHLVYPGAIPVETDLLWTARSAMVGLGALYADIVGTQTLAAGLPCTPAAGLEVSVGAGRIYALEPIDATPYSSLPADTNVIVKQGLQFTPVILNCPAPATGSVNYLIEAGYADVDANLTTLPYYNASNPTQAYSGPANNGQAQATVRQSQILLQAKAGVAAPSGSQVTPAADAGYIGLYVVTVAAGSSQIVAANITAITANFLLPGPYQPLGAYLTSLTLGAALYPRTAAELAAGVTPTNYLYPFGDLRRYGGDPTGVADSSVAWAAAVACGCALIAQGCTFKILTGATRTGQVTLLGQGATSVLLCDSTALTVNAGTGSVVDNFTMQNITAPYVISRNPNNWTTAATATQSNTVLGYQPTVNDPEYTALVAATPAIGTQNIGPQIIFQGNASNIEVFRIYGRFVCITLYDAQYSSVHDCDFRGGKNFGGICFWNINNQIGEGNKAYGNRVQNASYSGILMARNYDFSMSDNMCLYNGESGCKTVQDVLGGVDARCYKGLITNNVCNYNFFDGIDAMGSVGTATLEARLLKVAANYCFQNGGDGINIDGALNQIDSNWIGFNYRFGIWAAGTTGLAFSSVRNNHLYDNNQQRSNTQHDISITGNAGYAPAYSAGYGYLPGNLCSQGGVAYRALQLASGIAPPNANCWAVETPGQNHIEGNYVYAGPLQNNYGIYAPDTNYVADNILVNGATHFYGNTGSISAVVQDVVDGATGSLTDQFCSLQILNTGGTMQHNISSDNGTFAQNLISSRIVGAVNGNQNTATGADSTTAFSYGGKIGSANTSYFILNTLPQSASYFDVVPVITFNSSGTSLCVSLDLRSINVNGVTYSRPCLSFTVNGTGAAFALTPANIAAGKLICIVLKGKLA